MWVLEQSEIKIGSGLCEIETHASSNPTDFKRFIAEYREKYKIKISAVTVQNEPLAFSSGASWQNVSWSRYPLALQGDPQRLTLSLQMNFPAERERDFIRDHLGPTLRADGTAEGDKIDIIINDDQRVQLGKPGMSSYVSTVMSDPGAAKVGWTLYCTLHSRLRAC